MGNREMKFIKVWFWPFDNRVCGCNRLANLCWPVASNCVWHCSFHALILFFFLYPIIFLSRVRTLILIENEWAPNAWPVVSQRKINKNRPFETTLPKSAGLFDEEWNVFLEKVQYCWSRADVMFLFFFCRLTRSVSPFLSFFATSM